MLWGPVDGWRWILGLGVGLWVLARTSPARRSTRALALATLPLLGLGVATWLVRQLVVTPAFFLHVGRGPLWTCLALQPDNPQYGPGYAELLGWVVSLWPQRPDVAIFATQSVMGAAIPPFVWVLARRSGAPRPVAWAMAGLTAAYPALARAAASETYYAACIFLLVAAATVLAAATHSLSIRTPRLWLGLGASALLVSQAVDLHPVCWLPALYVPLVAAVGPGSIARRLRWFGLSVAVVGLTAMVGIASRVGDGGSSSGVSGIAHEIYITRGVGLLPMAGLVMLGAYVVFSRRHLHTRLRVLATGTVAIGLATYEILGMFDLPPAGDHAYAFLSAPALIAGLASLGTRSRSPRHARRLALGLAGVGSLALVVSGPGQLELSTEAVEANWIMTWRDTLPDGARVAHVTREGVIQLELPLYGGCGLPGPHSIQIDPDGAFPTHGRDPVFYYRSSLCSTERGAPLCAQVERDLDLDPVQQAVLPAVSHKAQLRLVEGGWAPPRVIPMRYREETVEVALFRVRGGGRP